MSEDTGVTYNAHETPVAYIDLRQELDQLTVRAQELQKEIASVESEARNSLINNILVSIDDHGFDRQEIVEQLQKHVGKKRGRKAAKPATTRKPAVTMVDPAVPGQTYSRGPYPVWIKERMVQLGLDPTNAEHRKQYRAENLVAVAA